MRIGYFPIREGVNLSTCLFSIRIVLSGLGLPVGVSQLCSPGSVVLCYRCPRRAERPRAARSGPAPRGAALRRAERPCAARLVGVNVVCVPRVTSAVAPRPGIVEAWPTSVRIPPGDHPPGVARRAAPPGAQQTAHRALRVRRQATTRPHVKEQSAPQRAPAPRAAPKRLAQRCAAPKRLAPKRHRVRASARRQAVRVRP